MSAASNYTEDNIINALLRGVAFAQASTIYVGLHTSDPTDAGGNEVTLAAFPAYERLDAAKGGAISSGWTASSNGVSKNANQLIYPVHDGGGDITVTHFALYDAATGGNMLVHAPLNTARTLSPGDVYVIDPQQLTVQLS